MNEIKITFQSICQLIQEKQLNMAENYVAIGYYLRKAREAELYKDGGYASIHEMAAGEFGMARQTAEHCMRINEKFSEGGDSPALEESFRKYGKSQLQEMLYLTDEQLEDVRPDMTVKDIRNIRKPVEKKAEEPEPKPELRQGRKPTEEAEKKVQQARAESEECSTSSKEPEEEPEEQIPGQDSIEEHPEWIPEDYEKQKPPIIEGECREVQQEEETEECSTSSMAEEKLSDLDILKDELDRKKRLLGMSTQIELDAGNRHVRKLKLVVGALAAAVCDLENVEIPVEESVQPELPVLKNNDQRKDWLRTYKDWGLWYRDENIGVEYYKYDFSNGARLIAEVYVRPGYGRCPVPSETAYLHLVGGPDPKKGSYGIEKWQKHEHYSKYPNSDTELVEFLKELQK